LGGAILTRVIGIISGKGGVGKTTVALNLGTVLAHHLKKNVTVIDCNVTTSHIGLYLGIYYSPSTLNKVLRGESSIEEAIIQHFSGMKVIPASLSLSDLEGIDITQLKDKLREIFENNDIILLDASPGLGREALAALKASNEVIFVTTPYIPCVMDIVRCQEVINELGIKPLGIVLNMVNKKRYEMTPIEIEQLTRLPVIASIPFDKNVNKSLASKIPIVVFKPKTKASKELIKLGTKLFGETYKPKGKFSRFVQRLRSSFKRKKSELLVP
jgi:septum site-determining protein MinD